jgi:hypothetical protein
MSGPYCTVADLYNFGLPRGSLPNPGRQASSVDASTNAFTLADHGFATGDVCTLRAEAGGSLPAPLVAATEYYVRELTPDVFELAATDGGAAINLTTAGSRVLVIARLNREAAILFGAALIDDMLPAHTVPLMAPYPPIVTMTNAELAIWKLTQHTGSGTASLIAMVDAARARLERWGKGVPLRGTNTDAQGRAQLSASASAPYTDPRGWNRYGGL